jgi:hypothetical protein
MIDKGGESVEKKIVDQYESDMSTHKMQKKAATLVKRQLSLKHSPRQNDNPLAKEKFKKGEGNGRRG